MIYPDYKQKTLKLRILDLYRQNWTEKNKRTHISDPKRDTRPEQNTMSTNP